MRNKADSLHIEQYPKVYQSYLEEELKFLENNIKLNCSLLDVGCGVGRMIPIFAPRIRSYLGIDIDSACLDAAKKVSSEYSNTEVRYGNAEDLSQITDQFDMSICMWNTLGNISNPKKAIEEMNRVSKRTLLTVVRKGNLEARKGFYETLGIPYHIEPDEVFVTPIWGTSRSFSEQDILSLTKDCNSSISIQPINNLAYSVIMKRI